MVGQNIGIGVPVFCGGGRSDIYVNCRAGWMW